MDPNSTSNTSCKISEILAGYRGLYARVSEKAGVDASYVSRIADGSRRNDKVARLLMEEINNLHAATQKLLSGWAAKSEVTNSWTPKNTIPIAPGEQGRPDSD